MIMSFDDIPKFIDECISTFILWQVDVERPIEQFTEHLGLIGELLDKASHESLGPQSICHGL